MKSHPLILIVFALMIGNVVRVVDGDTLIFYRWENHKTYTIRLYGIDCPEMNQPGGKAARFVVEGRTSNREIQAKITGKGKYGRSIGILYLPGKINLNNFLVEQGHCWWNKKYAPHDEMLKYLQMEAWANRRGLWLKPNPIPPWEWRKDRR